MKKLFCRTDPVDVATGEVVMSAKDVALAGVFPLILERHYRTSVRSGRWFGPSWASTIDQRLIIDQDGVRFTADDGMVLYYPVPEPDVPIEPVEGPRWQLHWDGTAAGTMTIHQPDSGRTLYFRPLPGRSPAELPIAAIADRNGNAMRIEYGADGAPREVVHDGGYRVGLTVDQGRITALGLLSAPGQPTLLRYDYDETGNLSAVYNSSGLPLKLDYDQQRRITRWEDRNGTWYRYRYDSAGRCIHAVGSDRILEYTFDYDERLNVTLVTDSLGFTTRYEFNDAYQLISETDALGNSTVREWDRYDRVQSVVDPLGYQTSYEYDAGGNLATLTRPDGREIKAEYNAFHLPEVVVGTDGATWRNEYDARGNIVRSEDPAGNAKTFVYNTQGHLVESVNALGESLGMATNAAGLPLAITDPLGNTTAYSYDAFGRVIRVKDPLEGVTTLAWSLEGKVVRRVSPDGAEELNAYDPEGNLRRYTDPAGGVTRFESSHFDRLAAKVNPDGTRYEFSYDTELQLRQVTNPAGLTWHYEYDATGGLVGERDFNGRLVSYIRDAAGRLASRTNGAGEVSHYTRDAFGNVVEQRNEHDGVGGVTRFAYDAANRMTSAANNSAVVAVQYDILGNVISETCNDRVTAYAYDQLGRRTQRTTPSGLVSSIAYDEAGRLATLGGPGQHIGFSYDALGRETQRQWGAGVSLAQSWTDGHQLASQVLVAGAPSSSQLQPVRRERSFAYRADGYLTDIRDSYAGHQHFTLDQVGHVTAVQGQGWSEAYAHDASGNLTYATWEQESSTSQPSSPSTAPQNITYSGTLLRRSGRSVYEYDGQGRVIRHTRRLLSGGKRTWQFHWDADDRITGVVTPDGTNWRYLYDPLGRRIGKQQLDPNGSAVVQETTFTWDADRIIEEETTRDSREDRHITTWDWAPDTYRPVAQTDRVLPLADAPQEEIDQRFYAIVTDLVGAPTELVDDTGNVAWKSRATLWGADRKEQNNSANCPLRFPGQYHDDETGLHYNNFRYYDPETAGYRSPDPLGLSASPNQHAYVPNPQTWADPLGLRCTPPSDAQLLADARAIHDAVRIGRSPIGARIAHQRMTVVTGDLNGELVYSVNHNMTAPAVRETAERLGYRRVNGIRYTGADSTDAEQVMFNAIDAGDLPSTGRMAPSRPACGPERQDCRGRFDDYPDIRLIE
nr:RHS repeat-associated core domain-containing protein [Streptomyces scabichelini]